MTKTTKGNGKAAKLAKAPKNEAKPLGRKTRNSASTAPAAKAAAATAAPAKAPRDAKDVAIIAVDVGKDMRARIDDVRKKHGLSIHAQVVAALDAYMATAVPALKGKSATA